MQTASRRQFLTTTTLGAATLGWAAGPPAGRIRIAQIGTGHSHAAGKLAAIKKHSALFDLAGLATNEPTKGEVYAGVPRLSEKEILEDTSIRAVVVETAMDQACATAKRAIEAGKHIHLDKPGALKHTEFRAMRLDASKRGLIVQMGYMLRYNPAFSLMFRAAREGWFGEITEVDAMMGKKADASFLRELAAIPGHGMFELGCHMVDAVLTLLGKPSAVRAYARSTGQDGLIDNQTAVLEYPKSVALLRCNHADPFGNPRRRFLVTGTRGGMEILPMESGRCILRLSEDREQWAAGENQLALPVPAGRYDLEFQEFARVIDQKKELAWSAVHDCDVHETALRTAGVTPEG